MFREANIEMSHDQLPLCSVALLTSLGVLLQR